MKIKLLAFILIALPSSLLFAQTKKAAKPKSDYSCISCIMQTDSLWDIVEKQAVDLSLKDEELKEQSSIYSENIEWAKQAIGTLWKLVRLENEIKINPNKSNHYDFKIYGSELPYLSNLVDSMHQNIGDKHVENILTHFPEIKKLRDSGKLTIEVRYLAKGGVAPIIIPTIQRPYKVPEYKTEQEKLNKLSEQLKTMNMLRSKFKCAPALIDDYNKMEMTFPKTDLDKKIKSREALIYVIISKCNE